MYVEIELTALMDLYVAPNTGMSLQVLCLRNKVNGGTLC